MFLEGGTLRSTAEDCRQATLASDYKGIRFVRRGTAHSLEVVSGSPRLMLYELK